MSDDQVVALMAAVLMTRPSGTVRSTVHEARVILRETRLQMTTGYREPVRVPDMAVAS